MEKLTSIETQIAARVIDALLAAGYSLDVNDGEETTIRKSKDKTAILGALFTTGEDYLIPRDASGKKAGWVLLIGGNDIDLVSDYTVNLESVMEPVTAWINEYEKSL